MKKFLLSAVVMLSMAMTATSEVQYALKESFEDGQVPEGWTQEYVAGQQDWIVESENLTYPAGAADGNFRIALRNTTSQTIGFTTRLVSPVMDLSEVYQPILVFQHAQQQRSGDFDTLKVYYRTAVDRNWVLLKSFDKKAANWVRDTVELDAASKTYQVAFEVTDNFGRGVVLDNVFVRPMPTCSDPTGLTTEGLTTTSFKLRWNGSLDTDSFEVLINKTAIDDLYNIDEDNLWKRVFVDPSVAGFVYETGDVLERNTQYYVYIRALCSGEISQWASLNVRTQNIVNTPYFVDFNNYPYVAGTVTLATGLYWTIGSSIEGFGGPFINTNEEPGAAATKQKSADGTHVLVFAGANSTSTSIPAGQYVYAATPELNVDNVSNLMVSFQGTAYQYYATYNSTEYAGGLIVGVMTDPQDIETFVAIDTVWAKGSQVFGYYQVPLSSYTGNGKYVAFLSRFEKNNLFFIDNLTIATRQDYPMLTTFEYSVQDGNTIRITPNTQGASTWDIFIMPNQDELSLTPIENKIIYSKTGITDASYTIVDDTIIDTSIQIYVRANGVYSLPERVLMPEKLTTFPRVMSFKTANNKHTIQEMKSNWVYSLGSGTIPEGFIWKYDNKKFGNPSTLSSSSTSSISGYSDATYAYFLNIYKKGEEKDIYMALPAVDDVKKVMLSFYMTATASTTYPEDIATIAIGVMSDPYDINTFVAMDTVVGEKARYNQYMATFESYNGTGKFIAIRGIPSKLQDNTSSSQTMCYAYFDDITINLKGECNAAAGILKDAKDTTLTLTWAANGANKWNVKLYSKAVEKKVREGVYTYTVEEEDLIDDKDVNVPSYENKALKPHTSYYYNVSTYCGDDTIAGALTEVKTDCRENGEVLPYVEDFENYQGVGSSVRKIANCWTTKWTSYAYSESPTSYYPYIYLTTSTNSSAHAGYGCMAYGCSSVSNDMYVALPKFDVDSVKRLQLSLWMKGATATYEDTMLVGVMTDPEDVSTFTEVSYFVLKGNVYQEFVIPMSSYEGKGEYIAVKKKLKDTHYYYMDDFKVKLISNCGVKVSGVEATRLDTATAIKWTVQDVDKYEVMVTKSEIEDMENIPADKVMVRRVVANAYDTVLNNEAAFISNTTYYVYVRTYCSASNTGDWSNATSYKTACMPETPESFGVEDFTNADRKDCWQVGIDKLIGSPSLTQPFNANNYLYLYNAKGTATSLGQTYAIMPTINIDSIKNVEVTFQAHCGTNQGILDLGVCVEGYDSYMYVDSINLAKVSAIGAATGYGFNEALYYTVRFTDYLGDADGNFGKKIVFKGRGNANALNYCYIKNISLRRLSDINEPINVTIPDSTIIVGSAVVNWDAQEGADGYDIKYSTAQIDPDMDTVLVAGTEAVIKFQSSSTNSTTLLELPGLTRYYVYVRSRKGSEYSVWSNMRTFKSSCPVAFDLPFSENFDGYVSGYANYPDCWERYYTPASATSTTVTACVYSTAKYGTSGNGLYVGSTLKYGPSYFVLPKMDEQVKNLMISFVYKSNAKTATQSTSGGPNRYMAIGVASDISSEDSLVGSVVWMDTIICSDNTNFADYAGEFSKYTGTGEYIVFCGYGGSNASSATNTTVGGLYIDNLLIEKIPTCFAAKISQTNATTSSITVAINDNFGQTAWDIAVVAPGAKPVVTKTVTTEDAVNGEYVITGLDHSTNYDVYVRANCGSGDVSKWSDVVPMKTMVKLALSKAKWDFEYTADERANYLVLSPKATSTSYLIDPTFVAGNPNPAATYSYYPYLYPTSVPTSATASMYGYNSDFAMRLYSTTSYPTQWFTLPEINANLDTLQITFKATSVYMSNRSTKALTVTYAKGTYPHSMKVGIMSDPNDFSTFSELAEYVFPIYEKTTANEDDPMEYWNQYTLNLFGAEAKGKYIAFATDYTTNTNYAYIDDIELEPQTGCGAPSGLNVVDSTLTATSADVVWVSPKLKWQVQLVENGATDVVVMDSIVSATEIAYETQFSLKDLTPNSKYTIRVKTICSDEEESDWSEKAFATPCAPYEIAEAVWNFEDNLYQYGSSASYMIPGCWTVGAVSTTVSTGVKNYSPSQSYAPYAIANTSSSLYAQGSNETTAKALRFYTASSSSTMYEAWAQMPAMNFTMTGKNLHFYGRASYVTKSSKKMVANANYTKKLYFGVMDNDDINTFVKLDSIEYTKTLTTNDLCTDDEDEYWQEYLVPLDKFDGKKIVIYAIGDNEKTSYFFIDNLEILPADYCFRPTNINSGKAYADRIELSWRSNGKDVEIQVASDDEFNTIVVDTIVKEANTLLVKELPASTELFYRLRSICSETEKSDWASVSSFTTLYAVRFYENFQALALYPENWGRYSKKMNIVVDSAANMIGAQVSATTTSNFRRYPSNVGMNAGHMMVNLYSSSQNYWLLTPQIDLTTFTDNDKLALSFDLCITDGEAHTGLVPDLSGGQDKAFVVAVSTDNGATWSSENLTVWANKPFGAHVDKNGDTTYVEPKYIFNEISTQYGGEKVYVDMSKFAGQIITIAFYGESSVTKANGGGDYDLHIDNVQLNTYSINQYAKTTCRWEDYADNDFTFDVEDYKVGETTTYSIYNASSKLGGDKLVSLDLTVLNDAQTLLEDTICEGEEYSKYNFSVEAQKSGIYKQKLAGSVSCDSSVVLNLFVYPKQYDDSIITICHGKYVTFQDTDLYTSGNYTFTYTSVTGCDSIVTVHLTVQEILHGENEAYLCPNSSVEFGDTTIYTPGIYSRIIDVDGCDSLATLNVIEAEVDSVVIRAAICNGSAYDVEPFKGLSRAGDYPIHSTSKVTGCDSITTLHLMVIDPEIGSLRDSIGYDELPYVLNGIELVPAGTSSGVYTRNVNVCGGDIVVTLVIGEPTALHSVFASTLAVAPNPAAVGEPIRVYGEFANDATLEVVSSVGAVVYTAQNLNASIVVPGLPAAGVYLVRVTSDNQVYQAKVLVK